MSKLVHVYVILYIHSNSGQRVIPGQVLFGILLITSDTEVFFCLIFYFLLFQKQLFTDFFH